MKIAASLSEYFTFSEPHFGHATGFSRWAADRTGRRCDRQSSRGALRARSPEGKVPAAAAPMRLALNFIRDIATPHVNELLRAVAARDHVNVRLWYSASAKPEQYGWKIDPTHQVLTATVFGNCVRRLSYTQRISSCFKAPSTWERRSRRLWPRSNVRRRGKRQAASGTETSLSRADDGSAEFNKSLLTGVALGRLTLWSAASCGSLPPTRGPPGGFVA